MKKTLKFVVGGLIIGLVVGILMKSLNMADFVGHVIIFTLAFLLIIE